jgi:uncharacterized protein (DUF2236 family)
VEIVSTEDLERALEEAAAHAAGPTTGLFGPQSVTWQVSREAAVFLGAGRALLLQLAHPWVAAAIEEHSKSLADPIGRFHRTFATVHTMVFGSLDQCLAAARRLHQRHAAITGTLRCAAGTFDEGSFYCANEASALHWVHATLIETALMAYALVLPPLSEPQRERYFEELSVCRLVRHSSIVAAARLAGFFRVYRNNAGVRQSVGNPSSTRHCASSPQFSYAGDLPCVDGRASAASAA